MKKFEVIDTLTGTKLANCENYDEVRNYCECMLFYERLNRGQYTVRELNENGVEIDSYPYETYKCECWEF